LDADRRVATGANTDLFGDAVRLLVHDAALRRGVRLVRPRGRPAVVSRRHAGARRLAHLEAGLRGAGDQVDALGDDAAAPDHLDVSVGQLPVPRDAGVADGAVEPRPDADVARPVLRRDAVVDRGEVRVGHAHQPPALDAGLASGGVAD